MLRGLLGRRLLRGLNNRFGFAENSKLANKPTIKTVPAYDAKWKAGLMDPVQSQLSAETVLGRNEGPAFRPGYS